MTLTIKDTLKAAEPQYAELLRASGADIKKFMNNAIIAAQNPDLREKKVSTSSIFNVCSRAAQDGVMLDNKEAAMIVGWNSKTRQNEAQYRLMAAGVMKIINRSPEIVRVVCQLVYETDRCEIDLVTDGAPILHTIDTKKPRGNIVGVYALAKLDVGWTSPEYIGIDELMAIRDRFAPKNKEGEIVGPWKTDFGEMCRKTVLARAKKRMPISDSVADTLAEEEIEYDIHDADPDIATPKKSSLDSLKEQMAAVVDEGEFVEVPI